MWYLLLIELVQVFMAVRKDITSAESVVGTRSEGRVNQA